MNLLNKATVVIRGLVCPPSPTEAGNDPEPTVDDFNFNIRQDEAAEEIEEQVVVFQGMATKPREPDPLSSLKRRVVQMEMEVVKAVAPCSNLRNRASENLVEECREESSLSEGVETNDKEEYLGNGENNEVQGVEKKGSFLDRVKEFFRGAESVVRPLKEAVEMVGNENPLLPDHEIRRSGDRPILPLTVYDVSKGKKPAIPHGIDTNISDISEEEGEESVEYGSPGFSLSNSLSSRSCSSSLQFGFSEVQAGQQQDANYSTDVSEEEERGSRQEQEEEQRPSASKIVVPRLDLSSITAFAGRQERASSRQEERLSARSALAQQEERLSARSALAQQEESSESARSSESGTFAPLSRPEIQEEELEESQNPAKASVASSPRNPDKDSLSRAEEVEQVPVSGALPTVEEGAAGNREKSTMRKIFDSVYKVNGWWDRGNTIWKVAAWIATIATAFFPMLVMFIVAKIYDNGCGVRRVKALGTASTTSSPERLPQGQKA